MVKRFAKEELMYVFHCYHNITLVQLLLKKPLNWKTLKHIRNFKDVKICQKKNKVRLLYGNSGTYKCTHIHIWGLWNMSSKSALKVDKIVPKYVCKGTILSFSQIPYKSTFQKENHSDKIPQIWHFLEF